jgi:hypothetical protein
VPRARNIKPGFFRNEELVELDFEQRLLFIGLWTLADREGRLEDRPKRIKMELFPADDVNVDAGLQAMHELGLVVRYVVDGRGYIWIPKFLRHQKPHRNEVESEIPPYDPMACESREHGHAASNPDESGQGQQDFAPRAEVGQTMGDSTRADSLNPDCLNPESLRDLSVSSKAKPPTPYSEIVDLYHQQLPDLARVVKLTDQRRQRLRKIHEGIMERDLDNWRGYWGAVRRSDFLMGRKKDWRADFDFLTRPNTPLKVLEGSYS